MSKKASPPVKAADEPDEFHGIGGSYVVGADGKRTLAERTKPAEEQPVKE